MSGPSPKAFAAPWEAQVFAAPWEAQVFALVVSLQESGLFTWTEWADRLGREIRPADEPERPADYAAWLITLEGILAERGMAASESVARRTEAFLRAAAATPHGQAIRLENDPHYRA